jgi:AraC family transcriptional regulator
MQPRIKLLKKKILVGQHLKMSLTNNKTGELWRQFGPKIKAIQNRVSNDKISMQIYPADYYQNFSPNQEFEKWATVEVQSLDNIPEGMESFLLKEGLYAIFDYKGPATDTAIFQYIFRDWLPNSNYQLDGRPHFEVLGDRYSNYDPDSEEEIWIPIQEQ